MTGEGTDALAEVRDLREVVRIADERDDAGYRNAASHVLPEVLTALGEIEQRLAADATTATAAADAVTEIATDRARVREQRDRALDLAEALANCDDGTERARLRGELQRLRRVVAGSVDTETGTDPEHPEEGR